MAASQVKPVYNILCVLRASADGTVTQEFFNTASLTPSSYMQFLYATIRQIRRRTGGTPSHKIRLYRDDLAITHQVSCEGTIGNSAGSMLYLDSDGSGNFAEHDPDAPTIPMWVIPKNVTMTGELVVSGSTTTGEALYLINVFLAPLSKTEVDSYGTYT